MTLTPQPIALADAAERQRAATTFDANIVVTAGAGTGKTTLLVERLAHLLLRDPDPVPITQIVALTFTNKAANEMRVRLRQRLQNYIRSDLGQEPVSGEEAYVQADLRSLMARYHLSKDQVDARAQAALRQLERSYLGTIHSFAALLLRLYPAEAGIDPQFQEDDGSSFKNQFDEQWSVWLDQELGPEAKRQHAWKRVLASIPLESMRDVSFSLCSEMVPLERLVKACKEKSLHPTLHGWLTIQEREARGLIERYPESRNQIDCFARYALRVLESATNLGEIPASEFSEERRWFAEKNLRMAGKWSEEDFGNLQRLCRIARRLLRADGDLTCSIMELLAPFAEACRASFLKQGFMSFDGLLIRARNLLRDHPNVREELKSVFKALLVDEFQDTDPLQYEIILYLAEQPGTSAADWESVKIRPGKLFVVGDPKQSIYAFRRADIQAYLDVVERMILAQGGIECRLTTNFRSHKGILDVVNGVFEPLIHEREGLQPKYVSIQTPVNEQRELLPGDNPFRKVILCRIACEEELSADAARRLEAENLARWLQEEVFGKARVRDRDGQLVTVQPKHVAFLFRKLTDVDLYLEPLRRRNIRYTVEGEKHFYATQEIIDAVNLLRAVNDPHDRMALVGLLRSPAGGFSDTEIYHLHRQGLLDYAVVRRSQPTAEKLGPVRKLYETLDRLHAETRTLSVADAVHTIFETIPIRLLAARGFNGEQAVANIEKIRQQATVMGRTAASTLKDVVARLERRVLEVQDEGESPLVEESIDAVKLLSIHKAKGLEFPIVLLPDARGAANAGRAETGVQVDWCSDLIGLETVNHCNPAAIYLDEKKRLREEEEQTRLFYVGMTRARELLMISVPPLRVEKGSFVDLLQAALGELPSIESSIAAGQGKIEVRNLRYGREAPRRAHPDETQLPPNDNRREFVNQWAKRSARYEAAGHKALFVSPTAFQKAALELTERFAGRSRSFTPLDPLTTGKLAHGFLESIDFSASRAELLEALVRYIDRQPDDGAGNRSATLAELTTIFSAFFASPIFAEISGATILGREIPFMVPWDGQIMEGAIDLLYERDKKIYIGDYKTDRINIVDVSELKKRYHYQAEIYSAAARRSLQRDIAAFKLILLRSGDAVEMDLPS